MKNLLLTVVMACLSMTSFGQSGTAGNLTWTLDNDGTLTISAISGTGVMPDYNYSGGKYSPWFSLRDNIKKAIIEDGVTNIGNSAFTDHKALISVSLPGSLTSIGSDAFRWCYGLTSVSLPGSLTSIGSGAFGYCTEITSISIPKSVTIGVESAFDNCAKLTEFVIEAGNMEYASINGVLFNAEKTDLICYPNGKSETSYTVPNGVQNIGDNVFRGCDRLTSIILPNSLKTIGSDAFISCSSLESIIIQEGVASIGDYAFSGCSALKSITLPNSLMSIGFDTFYGCGLTSVTIPNGDIGDYAFEECTSLASVTLGSGVTSIGMYAFVDCGLTSITIPKLVATIGHSAFSGCKNLTGIAVERGNLNYTAVDGVLFNSAKTDLLCYPNGKPGASYTVPDGVQNIGDYAFEGGCVELTSINFPNSLKTIGEGSFWGDTQLTSIIIPNSVTSIGNWPFMNCSGLSYVVIPNSVTAIGSQAFANCTGLKYIISLLSDPSQVKLGSYVFQNLTQSAIKLFVPTGTLSKYQNIGVWNGFDIQEGGEQYDLGLSSLTINRGTLYPSFDPITTSYMVSVGNSIDVITLSAIPVQSSSTVSGSGEKTLALGENTFDITVKAQSGEIRTYTVKVFRLSGEYAFNENGSVDITKKESYYMAGPNKTFDFDVIIGRYLYYTLTTFDLSGNLTIHFEFDNGVTCDRTIAVQPNSRYNITLLLSIDPTNGTNIMTTVAPVDAYGNWGTPYVKYVQNDYILTVTEGSNFLLVSPITVQGKLTAASVSDVTLDGTYTSINSVESSSLRLFPNPATDFVSISGLQGNETLYFYNINGQLLITRKASVETENVPVGNLPSGIYFVKISNGQTLKLVKR